MPSIPIIMPQLGESIAEASIINFLVKPGDTVEAGQDLIEVETNKANMNVTSPRAHCKNHRAIERKLHCRRSARPD
jgi:acetyl/propionyl-CoA carboxylase alpha subunit